MLPVLPISVYPKRAAADGRRIHLLQRARVNCKKRQGAVRDTFTCFSASSRLVAGGFPDNSVVSA